MFGILEILFIFAIIGLWFYSGNVALKRIKQRDPECPFAVDIMVVIHGFFSWISVLAIQNLLYPPEELTEEQKVKRLKYLQDQIDNLKNGR